MSLLTAALVTKQTFFLSKLRLCQNDDRLRAEAFIMPMERDRMEWKVL